MSIAELDKEWEDYWTEASSVLKAIQNNTPPLAAISKGVEKWLDAGASIVGGCCGTRPKHIRRLREMLDAQ